jgi:hypothetical protein
MDSNEFLNMVYKRYLLATIGPDDLACHEQHQLMTTEEKAVTEFLMSLKRRLEDDRSVSRMAENGGLQK